MNYQSSKNLGQNSQPEWGLTSAFAHFSPLGHIPLTASKTRRWGDLRTHGSFLAALIGGLVAEETGQEQETGSELYPWEHPPFLIAVDGASVLVDEHNLPLNLRGKVNLVSQKMTVYGQGPAETADLLYAGEYRTGLEGGQKKIVPVLALTGRWQTYLDFGSENLNLLGPDGEQVTLTDVLAARTGGRWIPVREFAEFGFEDGAATAVAREWGELLAGVVALNFWHSSHRFDPATGEPTRVIQAGWARQTATGRELFPRTDPAVITAVTATIEGEEKILLGQARAWAKNRFSTFAGFVEAGESLENAVVREILEECGGQVCALTYLGSQPWPFPRSLMQGFRAEIANPETVQADGEEIETIRWFSREELHLAHTDGSVILPGRSSISRKLIEYFYGGALDEPLASIA